MSIYRGAMAEQKFCVCVYVCVRVFARARACVCVDVGGVICPHDARPCPATRPNMQHNNQHAVYVIFGANNEYVGILHTNIFLCYVP